MYVRTSYAFLLSPCRFFFLSVSRLHIPVGNYKILVWTRAERRYGYILIKYQTISYSRRNISKKKIYALKNSRVTVYTHMHPCSRLHRIFLFGTPVLRHSCPFQSPFIFSPARLSSIFLLPFPYTLYQTLVHTRYVQYTYVVDTATTRGCRWRLYFTDVEKERSTTLNGDVYRLKGRFHRDTDRQVQYRLFSCERARSQRDRESPWAQLPRPSRLPSCSPTASSSSPEPSWRDTHGVCFYNINT